jgi:hypothetical protein
MGFKSYSNRSKASAPAGDEHHRLRINQRHISLLDREELLCVRAKHRAFSVSPVAKMAARSFALTCYVFFAPNRQDCLWSVHILY